MFVGPGTSVFQQRGLLYLQLLPLLYVFCIKNIYEALFENF
jgi:hypothetical protein